MWTTFPRKASDLSSLSQERWRFPGGTVRNELEILKSTIAVQGFRFGPVGINK